MRRSFKEKGKKLLNKFSGDGNSPANSATLGGGESSVVLQNTTECEYANNAHCLCLENR